MKLRFNEICKDKYTKELYLTDKIYEFDNERAKEILASGKAERIHSINEVNKVIKEAKQEKHIEEQQKKEEETKLVDMYKLRKNELIEIAKQVGVSIRGTKEEIIERILVQEVDNKAD